MHRLYAGLLPSSVRVVPCGLFGLALAFLVLWSGLPTSAEAQWESARLQPLSPTAQARGGIQLMRKGQPEEARPFLD